MPVSILWYRQDLRTKDNPALAAAAEDGDVLPVYILDISEENEWQPGGASKWWLHNSLQALMDSGVPLIIRKGNPQEELEKLIQESNAQSIHWNRCYEPYAISRDKVLKETLPIDAKSHNGSLLFEPWTIRNNQGNFYKVFSPFWKACLNSPDPRPPLDMPNIIFTDIPMDGLDLKSLDLLPTKPNWAESFPDYWEPGEIGAHKKLKTFIEDTIGNYKIGRDFPAKEMTSRLSPHLHYGEISPQQIWDNIKKNCDKSESNVKHFLSELGWREFSYNLLYHFPDLPKLPFQDKFNKLPWRQNQQKLEAWENGLTGVPIVDAGMRELWKTGYMHNRVRMITASYLTKHCLIPWQDGEAWFWDCLVDADLASNSASWQWVAGSGADAAPYFRIFNPVTQGQKFDPDGDYVRKWVPEVKGFPNKHVHAPWEASKEIQKESNCEIGTDYPTPIIDLDQGRKQALEAYDEVRN